MQKVVLIIGLLGISLLLCGHQVYAKNYELKPIEALDNTRKFHSDAREVYKVVFTSVKEWKELVQEYNVDIEVAAKCSADTLTEYFQNHSRKELEQFEQRGQKKIMASIAIPAMSCFSKQMGL